MFYYVVEGNEDDDDCIVVEVRKATKPLEFTIKKEILDDDDEEDAFYGFSLADIPRPIIIKVCWTHETVLKNTPYTFYRKKVLLTVIFCYRKSQKNSLFIELRRPHFMIISF
jgi:hypothetical protein